MHESCGVFGVYYFGEDVARLTYFALFALQHRVGQGNNALAIAHNGNIINAEHLYEELVQGSQTFRTSTDSKVIANLIISSPEKKWVNWIRYAAHRLQGAYSLCLMTSDSMFAAIYRFLLPYLSSKYSRSSYIFILCKCIPFRKLLS